jgi:hypothetical protein
MLIVNDWFPNVPGAVVVVIVWCLDLQLPMQSVPITTKCCEFESRSWLGVIDATLCDKVCQWLAAGRWFSPGTLVSSTNKTDHHDIIEILLKVAWSAINQPNQSKFLPKLRINIYIFRLDGLDDNAYAAFQASRDLKDVVERVMEGKNESKPGMSKRLSIRASLMTPVLPMLVGLFSFLTIYTVIMWNRNIHRKCQCFP